MATLGEREWARLVGGVGALSGTGFVEVGEEPSPAAEPVFTLPNLITLAGYAAGLAWLAGASPVWALVSLWADELDGEVARATGETTVLGDRLDSSVDYCMAALVGMRLGLWWTLPATLFVQVWQKEHAGFRPMVGSARAVGMIYALARGV